MTVEERAQKMAEDDRAYWWEGKEELKARYAKHLRDQIEDCAKIADEETLGTGAYQWRQAAEYLAENIRALAGPTSTSIEERKESGR